MNAPYRIGDLARHTDTPVETIRYYERSGLLPAPPRSSGNYRLYGDAALARLRFIRHCRSLDMALDEIRALLAFQDAPQESCDAVNAVIDAHIDHVATRIAELKKLDTALRALRAECHALQSGSACGILQGLARPADKAVKGVKAARAGKASHGAGVHAHAGGARHAGGD